jgi:hypothetical protein
MATGFQFPEWTQNFKKWTLLLAAGAPLYLVVLVLYGNSAAAVRTGYQPRQPVPYSHALHVGELGLDCRYCHNTVEQAGHSAIPSPATCMNCHKTVRSDSAALLPVREAVAGGKALEWTRVHDLPDYVFFNHSAHVNRGVGCESCHGRVDLMPEVNQDQALTMSWCLECHRDPTPHLRPQELITTMGWKPEGDRREIGRQIAEKNQTNPPTNCSTCHR